MKFLKNSLQVAFLPFFLGATVVFILVGALRKPIAQRLEDPRVQKIEDPTISGLKTETPGPSELESALKKRQEELDLKEKRLAEIEEKLRVEEERLKDRITELEKVQSEIASSRDKNKISDESVKKRLVKTFESMQPKKAAAIISSLTDDVAVEVILGMKEKKAAQIFEVMEPTKAASLNLLVANRKPAATEVGSKN